MVDLPEEQSIYLDYLEQVTEFEIKNGGRYMSNKKMTFDDKIEVTRILTELVIMDESTISNDENKSYRVVPKIIRNFAERSRVHSGYRLCKRAIRHAMDHNAVDICSCNGHVIKYKEQIGLELKDKIKASMKTTIYNVRLALTKDTLIACECDCKAGLFGKESIVCVHMLPVLYQFSQFIFRGMNEHMLVEISNYLKNQVQTMSAAIVKKNYLQFVII